MKYCSFLVLSLMVCNSCQYGANLEEDNSKEFAQFVPASKTEYDSLGYPSYYTHPEIRDINALRGILASSDIVVAYNYNKGEYNPANMGDDNQYLFNLETSVLSGGAYNSKILRPQQRRDLIEIVTDSNNYSGNWSGLAGVCYIPHAGFGFFKDNSLISQVSVCFICSGIRTNPFNKSDGLSKIGYENFESFVQEVGLEVVNR